MLRATKVFVRPNTDAAWYEHTSAYVDHMQQTYVAPGLRLNVEKTISSDGLTSTVVTEWNDAAAYDQYMNDPVSTEMFAARKVHNEQRGIQGKTPVTATI